MSKSALCSRFIAEEKAFSRLRKLFESKVVRWEYWDWPEWHWEPDYFLDAGQKSKHVTKARAKFGYGYDKENKATVIHEFDEFGGFGCADNLHSMQFLRWSGRKIVGSQFHGATVYAGDRVAGTDFKLGGQLTDVFEVTLSEGRIVRVEHLMEQSCDWKTIEWEGDKVRKVTLGMHGRKPHQEITYDKKGKVIDDIDLSEPIKRKPLPKGVTMNSLAKEIRKRLAAVVVQTITEAKVKEPAYCLALNYDCEGNPLLLPEPGIGLESERQAILKRGGRDAKLDTWQPENFSLFAKENTILMDRDKKLDRACDLYNRELEYKGSDEPARKLILQVAADLAKVNWKEKLNTTDDFIVYAVDTYGADLKKNLKFSVPSKQLAKLKASKLI